MEYYVFAFKAIHYFIILYHYIALPVLNAEFEGPCSVRFAKYPGYLYYTYSLLQNFLIFYDSFS